MSDQFLRNNMRFFALIRIDCLQYPVKELWWFTEHLNINNFFLNKPLWCSHVTIIFWSSQPRFACKTSVTKQPKWVRESTRAFRMIFCNFKLNWISFFVRYVIFSNTQQANFFSLGFFRVVWHRNFIKTQNFKFPFSPFLRQKSKLLISNLFLEFYFLFSLFDWMSTMELQILYHSILYTNLFPSIILVTS